MHCVFFDKTQLWQFHFVVIYSNIVLIKDAVKQNIESLNRNTITFMCYFTSYIDANPAQGNKILYVFQI